MNINIGIIDALTVTSLAMILAGSIPAPAGIASVEFVYTLLFSVIANSINLYLVCLYTDFQAL